MSWAEVKKINSDLSTPLDVLIKDLRERHLEPSDTLQYDNPEIRQKTWATNWPTVTHVFDKLQINYTGTLNVKFKTRKLVAGGNWSYEWRIRVGGEVVANGTVPAGKTIDDVIDVDVDVYVTSVPSVLQIELESGAADYNNKGYEIKDVQLFYDLVADELKPGHEVVEG